MECPKREDEREIGGRNDRKDSWKRERERERGGEREWKLPNRPRRKVSGTLREHSSKRGERQVRRDRCGRVRSIQGQSEGCEKMQITDQRRDVGQKTYSQDESKRRRRIPKI